MALRMNQQPPVQARVKSTERVLHLWSLRARQPNIPIDTDKPNHYTVHINELKFTYMNQKPPASAQVKSAERVLQILDLLAQHPEGLSFPQLVKVLALPKSSLYALLRVLTSRRYVEFDEPRRVYRLGLRIWETGQAYMAHHQLVHEARPVMNTIVGAINETVQLAVLDGLENVYLAKVDCSHPIRLQSEVGRRLRAHATGLGKVLLAYLPAAELAARLDGQQLARFTPQTITAISPLLADLARTRERGYALDDQEYTPGLQCVAVPIFDHLGAATAAISVSIPLMRGGLEPLRAALSLLAQGSLEISRHTHRPQLSLGSYHR
jgi:DNA-binding IclR family transcriptional regulator